MIYVITAWYNEQFLANLFLSHYSFADKIIILLDESNNDNSTQIISRYSNAEIRKLSMPHGMDDALKQAQINKTYNSIIDKNRWVIIADVDEFIYLPQQGLNEYLSQITVDIVKVDYYQMYQHKTENKLNIDSPVFLQRRHGKQIIAKANWKKPCIARTSRPLKWSPGHHDVMANSVPPCIIDSRLLLGAHWSMADIDLAIDRRINGRRNRMSPENLQCGFSHHNFKITAQDIIDECNENNNCPLIF